MSKTLSIGDFFMFSLEELKKINKNKQENDRIDHDNIEHAIRFFDENNIAFFLGDVVSEEDNISFKQSFLDENKKKISINGMFGNEFLLHLHEFCPMIERHNKPTILSLKTPVLINDLNFYDGDLYCIPLSAVHHYDTSLFTDKFNQAILGAKDKELTHIVFQINFPDGKRKSADDDLTGFFNKDSERFDYSNFNFTQNSFVRLFFTNKFGECHFNLEDLSEKNNKANSNDYLASHAFYSEPPNKEYFGESLDFISTLNTRSLYRLLQIDSFKKSIELIGNFSSEEYNYISTYDVRNLFKQHQIKKMTHLNDIKAIFIDKNGLPEKYHSNSSPETTHFVFLPVDHPQQPQFKQIFNIEAVSVDGNYHYSEIKKEISVFEFNQIIKESQHIQIIKKSEEEIKRNKELPLFFPFDIDRKIEKENSEIIYGVEFGNAYTIPLLAIKNSTNKDNIIHKDLEYLESLGVSNCIVHVSFPYHFLSSDENFIVNDFIYFDRERHLELIIYPLKKDTFEFLDLDSENYQLQEQEVNADKKRIPAPNIKLNTGDCLNVLKEQHSKMHLIEERKNPFFKRSSVLTRRMLKMYNDMLTEENKLSKKTSKPKF